MPGASSAAPKVRSSNEALERLQRSALGALLLPLAAACRRARWRHWRGKRGMAVLTLLALVSLYSSWREQLLGYSLVQEAGFAEGFRFHLLAPQETASAASFQDFESRSWLQSWSGSRSQLLASTTLDVQQVPKMDGASETKSAQEELWDRLQVIGGAPVLDGQPMYTRAQPERQWRGLLSPSKREAEWGDRFARQSSTDRRRAAKESPNVSPSAELPMAPLEFRPIRMKPLLWIHIHKAAGTYMCIMAKLMREKIVEPSKNCNWYGHDGYLDSGKLDRAVDCAARIAYFRADGFTYGHIEREVWSSDLCSEFSYGILLREPLDLIHSEINYRTSYHQQGVHKVEFFKDFKNRLREPSNLQEDPGQFANWKLLDNFQTRLIANAFDVPAGQLNETHYDIAWKRIAGFLVVGRVEDLGDDGRRTKLLSKLGWLPNLTIPVQNKMSIDKWVFTPDEVDFLLRMNRYDVKLYKSFATA